MWMRRRLHVEESAVAVVMVANRLEKPISTHSEVVFTSAIEVVTMEILFTGRSNLVDRRRTATGAATIAFNTSKSMKGIAMMLRVV